MTDRSKFVAFSSACLGALCLFLGCGNLGSGLTLNDPEPSYPILTQSTFTTVQTGKDVGGAVIVYTVDAASGSYIVRLSNLTTPAESNLKLIVIAGGTTVLNTSLRANNGNQNYSVTYTGGGSWQSASIRPFGGSSDYAIAVFP